ncbi:hypothetical protein ACFOLD_15820 [Kocuria carniphila]|uniref:hypothetical protein n=1 Tax=Kocuria carniphila TaxID=262208 RepID=UPI00361C2B55
MPFAASLWSRSATILPVRVMMVQLIAVPEPRAYPGLDGWTGLKSAGPMVRRSPK